MSVTFVLDGLEFQALNGGPEFPFTEAISLYVTVETQDEIDDLWEKLTSGGGSPSQCGWLKDKYGLSWQIVPTIMADLFKDENSVGAQWAMEAMLRMKKLDIVQLEKAAAG